MSVFITFAAALLIFGAVIAIHEFGHFAVAKLCGVQVNEFSIGMGPTLIKTYRKGTQLSLIHILQTLTSTSSPEAV